MLLSKEITEAVYMGNYLLGTAGGFVITAIFGSFCRPAVARARVERAQARINERSSSNKE